MEIEEFSRTGSCRKPSQRALHFRWQAHFALKVQKPEQVLSFANAMQQFNFGERDHHRPFN
jgi:hypothetical protein